MCDCGNLPIGIGSRSTKPLQARTLMAVPRGGLVVVWQNRKRSTDDILEVGFKGDAPLPDWETTTAVGEFVPDGGRDGAHRPVPLELPDDVFVRLLGDRCRRDIRIQEIPKRHSVTRRPVVVMMNLWRGGGGT